VIETSLSDQTSSSAQVTLLASQIPSTAVAGAILPIDIIYQVNETALPKLRWFVQLWNDQGVPVAFLDSAPDDGYGSFSTLQSEQEWIEMAGLLIPADAPAGLYRVIAGQWTVAACIDSATLQLCCFTTFPTADSAKFRTQPTSHLSVGRCRWYFVPLSPCRSHAALFVLAHTRPQPQPRLHGQGSLQRLPHPPQ